MPCVVVAVGLSGCAAPDDARDAAGLMDAGQIHDDAQIEDAAPWDASLMDVGTSEVDAWLVDDGSADAALSDGGSFDSGSVLVDAGPSDAGPSDAGPSDAGPSDAGPSDAGPSDAGPPPWPPVCGDGILQTPIEECEPGTASDDGYCARNCRRCGSPSMPGFFRETSQSCYALNSTPASWSQARDSCRARSADLVVYETEAEWVAVRDGIGSPAPFYIALYWNGGWAWNASRPLIYPHWSAPPTAPDYNSRTVQGADGLWQMVTQSAPHPSICERERRDGWFLWNDHGYVFFEDLQTWDFARMRCESRGGHLVTIGSIEEQFFLANERLLEAGAWIGLSDRALEGEPVWVNGEEPSYSHPFSSPNTDLADCVYTVSSSWQWLSCVELRPSICEIDPPSSRPGLE